MDGTAGNPRVIDVGEAARLLSLPEDGVRALAGAGYLRWADTDAASFALGDVKAFLARVADVDTAFKNIVNGRAEIGTRQAQLERAGNVNTELEASLDAQRTGIEKADLGSVIMDLKLQETNYQVALAATARVLQPTLMDFLR